MNPPFTITFFYYEDIDAIAPFYRSVMEFELVLDQGLAQIYRATPGCYLGIVDGGRGHLRHRTESAVLFTIVDDDVEGWHERMSRAGVSGLTGILQGRYCDHFFFRDPAGYALEVQRFRDSEVAALFRARDGLP